MAVEAKEYVSVEEVTDPARKKARRRLDQLDFVSLWPSRWPYIALQVCVDAVIAVPKEERESVRWSLPCAECPEAGNCLTAKERETGTLLFDREQRTRPRASGSTFFPRERMEKILNRESSLVEFYLKPFGIERHLVVGSAWDFAWSERAGGDWLAKVTGLLDRRTGTVRLLDLNRWQRLEFGEQCSLILAEHGRYREDFIVFEEEASQLVWRQHVTKNSAAPVIGHDVDQKKDLVNGIPGLVIDIDNRKWEIPYQAGTWNQDNVEQFLSELENFGWNGDKLEGVGEHDDFVVAWWHLRWGFERYRVPAGKSRRTGSELREGTEI